MDAGAFSPEIIKQSSGISTATDVWSYAVVVWELMSREIPYDGLTEFRIYTMIAEEHVKLAIPDTCPDQLAKLVSSFHCSILFFHCCFPVKKLARGLHAIYGKIHGLTNPIQKFA
jgi:serine/threonine protein kinase